MRIEADWFNLNETDLSYSPFDLLLDENRKMNELADRIQKAKGEKVLFLYDDTEVDLEDWYNFYLKCDGEKVTGMYYEYGIGGVYCGEIELDDDVKEAAYQKILDFFGGEEEYKRYIEEY